MQVSMAYISACYMIEVFSKALETLSLGPVTAMRIPASILDAPVNLTKSSNLLHVCHACMSVVYYPLKEHSEIILSWSGICTFGYEF